MSSHCFFNEILLFCFPNFSSLYSWDITLPPPFSLTVLSSPHFSLVISSRNTCIQTRPCSPLLPTVAQGTDQAQEGSEFLPWYLKSWKQRETQALSFLTGWSSWQACFPPGDTAEQGWGRQRWVGNLEMEDKKSWPNPNFRKKAVSVPVAQILNSWMRCSTVFLLILHSD